MIHYPTLKKEVLVAVRGKFSRRQCSEKLGFSFNKVQRWESGKAEVDWLEFIDLTRVCRRDLAVSFKKNMGFNGDLKDYPALLKIMIQDSNVEQVSQHLSVPKSTLLAWRKGKRVPKLIYMLQILHEYQRLLVDIIQEIIDLNKLPSLHHEVQQQKKMRDFFYQYPFSGGVLALLELEQDHFGKHLGISESIEREWIKKAQDLGIIEVQGKKIRLAPKLNFDTQGDFESHKRIKEYWILKTLERMKELKAPDPFDRFGYLVFSGSKELMNDIQKEYYHFFQKLKTMILSDEGTRKSEALCALNVQLMVKIPE